jgi:regulator of cell morphogenesis and NO signaling
MTPPTFLHPLTHRPLADLVAAEPRAAAVLSRFGLDFCCGGHQTLADAASRRQAPLEAVLEELDALNPFVSEPATARRQELDALTRLVVGRHHRYVRQSTPTIQAWLDKLVRRHGERHPELVSVRQTFNRLAEELAAHMVKEEQVLFPYIDELAAAARAGSRLPSSPFGTVLNPVRAMEQEHREAGELLGRLRTLTNGYAPPDDACATYRACYAELEAFETDLKAHVHLENHVLFPEAIELEERLI